MWLAAASVGGAQLALDYAISWCKTRQQGSKAVSDFQGVQFRMVDAHSSLMGARLLVRSAAQQVDARVSTASPMVSLMAAVVGMWVFASELASAE